MFAESVRFDDRVRATHSASPLPPGGVLSALREATETSGIDPVSELYNEALNYASEGHLRHARERLSILLGLAPDDGQARLLLAKVLVAGQRWHDALSALDEAQACGQHVPMELRTAIEDHIQADNHSRESQNMTHRARELGELKALRQEARRLRSENARLLSQSHNQEKEVRRWIWTTIGVTSVAIFFVALNVALSIGNSSEEVVSVEVTDVEAPVTPTTERSPTTTTESNPPTVEIPSTPIPVSSLADTARNVLATVGGLDNTQLAVTVRDRSAILSGVVETAAQRRIAETTLSEISGIEKVVATDVTVLARTKGTTHTVEGGDNLSKLAYNYYGESSLSSSILRANSATLKGKSNLSIGQTLIIPAID